MSKGYSGRQQDFAILKDMLAGICLKNYTLHVDLGFQGIKNLGISERIFIPFKASKNNPINAWQRAINRLLARERVAVENALAKMKSFFILRQENRMRKKVKLEEVFQLCAGLANFKSLNNALIIKQ
ncbi:transposase family protein [Hymenobacter sp. PAMC 26628]|uniref:transposase family protein n=1 Tax=Hymenobacter sp. PAMC 26628 TaxID=1484118 RepID=UPI001F19D4B6|nr:transposase family protein [Hymenobacter sp. PAMC 26628]